MRLMSKKGMLTKMYLQDCCGNHSKCFISCSFSVYFHSICGRGQKAVGLVEMFSVPLSIMWIAYVAKAFLNLSFW